MPHSNGYQMGKFAAVDFPYSLAIMLQSGGNLAC